MPPAPTSAMLRVISIVIQLIRRLQVQLVRLALPAGTPTEPFAGDACNLTVRPVCLFSAKVVQTGRIDRPDIGRRLAGGHKVADRFAGERRVVNTL